MLSRKPGPTPRTDEVTIIRQAAILGAGSVTSVTLGNATEVPFMNGDSVDFEYDADFTYDAGVLTAPKAVLTGISEVVDTITVGDASGAAGVYSALGKFKYTATGRTHRIRVYGYVTVGAVTVYSANYSQAEYVDDGLGGLYSINWSWDAIAGVSGYKILKYDDVAGYNYDYYKTTGSGTTTLNDGSTAVFSAGATVTPSSPYDVMGYGTSLVGEAGSILFSGTDGVTPASGTGTRLMWVPEKGAFRAGAITVSGSGDEWDADNIGDLSFAVGEDTLASGGRAFACGDGNESSGVASFSAGFDCEASGSYSVAMGSACTASGNGGVALSYNSTASGYYGVALASGTASGQYSVAMGPSTASNTYAVAMGNSTVASGPYSFSAGGATTASGSGSAAFGSNSVASGTNSFAIGDYAFATGNQSLSFGDHTEASGAQSFALGTYVKSQGSASIAYGYYTNINGYNAFGAGVNNNLDDTSWLCNGDGTVCFGEASYSFTYDVYGAKCFVSGSNMKVGDSGTSTQANYVTSFGRNTTVTTENSFNVGYESVGLRVISTEVAVNEEANSVDFRVEGDNEDNLFLVDASDDVVKVGDSDTNYTQWDVTGHQTMVGSAKPWEDVRVEPTVRQAAGTGVPAFEKYFDDSGGTSRGVFLYSFTDEAVAGNEKEVFFTMQMPHAWDGGDINLHVHFTPAATVASSDIVWGLEYCWKEVGETYGDTVIVQSSTTLVPDDSDITVGKHYIATFSALTPGSTADGISSILIGRLFRNSSDASDTYTNKVGLLYVDAHYQISSIGSNDEYTK